MFDLVATARKGSSRNLNKLRILVSRFALEHTRTQVRFVVALIDPSSASSSSSSTPSKTKEETQRISRQRRKSGDRALYAPLMIIKTLLSASIPDITYHVLESINNVGGMTIFWVALSTPVEDLRLMTLKLMRV